MALDETPQQIDLYDLLFAMAQWMQQADQRRGREVADYQEDRLWVAEGRRLREQAEVMAKELGGPFSVDVRGSRSGRS